MTAGSPPMSVKARLFTALKQATVAVPGVVGAVRRLRQRQATDAARRQGVDVHFDAGRIRLTKGGRAVVLAGRHLVYVPTVVDQFESFWGAVEPTEVGRVPTVDYSEPRVHRYAGSGLEFWLSSFPEEVEAIESYRYRYAYGPGDIVFDLGAYCGVSTYHFSKAVGEAGRVIAVEPDPVNFELLERNIARHELRNVTAVNGAVAGRPGLRAFNTDGTLGAALSDVIPRGVFQKTADVHVTTLADLSATYGVLPTFIKMDIEGAEVEALEASGEFLKTARCRFVIDSSHTVGDAITAPAVERALARAGYASESNTEFGLMTTWAWPIGS